MTALTMYLVPGTVRWTLNPLESLGLPILPTFLRHRMTCRQHRVGHQLSGRIGSDCIAAMLPRLVYRSQADVGLRA